MHPSIVFVVVLVLTISAVLFIAARSKTSRRSGKRDDVLRHRQREQVALLSIADAVITTDEHGNIDYMNTTAERLTEWDINAARGHAIQSIFQITDAETPTLGLDPVSQCIKEGRVVRMVKPVILRGRLSSRSEIEITVSPMRNRSGRLMGVVLVFSDVSKVRELQDHIDYQASHDSLTGLLHRQEFERLLEESIKSSHRFNSHHALCFMDINQFRLINENFGHFAGDELLVQLSALLRSAVRGDDTLARLGGDEFVILLNDCSLDEAVKKIESIISRIEESSFSWKGKIVDVSLAFSIVEISSASGSSNEVFKSAESACYSAKKKGRNKLVIYQSSDPELKRQRGEMRWASRIREALRNQEFELYYQNILPLNKEDKVIHCELLMRTEGDNHTLVPPEDFIPAAERFNLMRDIDRWVVGEAVKNIAELLKDAGLKEKAIFGINLSGQSLGDNSFVDYATELFGEYDVDPESICFEITETTAIANQELACEIIKELKTQGCQFALDDFGTGVSSFSYLKTYPFDYVKIDGSFIRNITSSPVDAVMVESVSRIAKVMGIKTIAEYVEDRAVLDRLYELGVDYAQGYGIAKPAPLKEWKKEGISFKEDTPIDIVAN